MSVTQDGILIIERGVAIRFDDSANPILYLGEAQAGCFDEQAGWRISLIDTSTGVSITWPNGDPSFRYVWDDRASYTYS